MLKNALFYLQSFYVSVPIISQSAFQIGRASDCILGQFEAGVRLVKALLFTVGTGLGDSLVQISSTCYAVGVSSQHSCEVCHLFHELGVVGNQGLVVDFHCRDCGRELLQNDLFRGCSCGYVVKVIF